MHYLILSTPSIEYADAISRELWLLVRPAGNETSQYYTGRLAHPDGTKVAIGPVEGTHPIHTDADEFTLSALISPAITDDEEDALIQTIVDTKGGSLDVLAMLQGIDSLSPNLRTREQLDADGWFTTEEV
jgi:hypothetical protein